MIEDGWTLGEAWRAGWKLKVKCAFGRRAGLKSIRECQASYDVDLPTLIWTRGAACPLDMLPDRMKCPSCGSIRVRLIWLPPPNAGQSRVVA